MIKLSHTAATAGHLSAEAVKGDDELIALWKEEQRRLRGLIIEHDDHPDVRCVSIKSHRKTINYVTSISLHFYKCINQR